MNHKIILICIGLSLSWRAYGIVDYKPKIADPMLEEWRYAYFPELEDKGLRSIASLPDKNQYWFGLDSGVMYYNGYDWIYYTHENGLTGGSVQKVFINNKDQAYAATASGLFKFNNGQWKNLLNPMQGVSFDFKSIKQLNSGAIVCGTNLGALFVHEGRVVLLTTAEKWAVLKNKLLSIEYLEIPSKLLHKNKFDNISDIFEVTDGQLWLATTYMLEDEIGDIMMFTEKEIFERQLKNFNLLSNYYDIQLGYEQSIFRSSNNHIWIINKSNKLPTLRFANSKWSAIEYGKSFGDDEYSESILETNDGKIWISGIGNLYCMDQNNTWTKYSSGKHNIPQGHVKLHSGKGEDLWIFGYQSLVYKVDLSHDKWLTYLDLNYQCEQTDGTTWFLDFNGNIIFNKEDSWHVFTKKHGLIDNPISLYTDNQDIIWAIGSHKGIASAGYLENQIWHNFSFDSLSWGIDYRAIYQSKDGAIWLGGCTDVYLDKGQNGGVIEIQKPYSRDRKFIFHKARTNGINQLNVYGLAQSKDGKMWIGGTGLCFYDGQKWDYLPKSDLKDFVNDVHNDDQGTLYVGSRQHGLYLLKDDQWINYSIKNSLMSNNIISIATQGKNREIWLATDKDYSFFNGEVWANDVFPGQLTLSYEGGTILLNGKNELWISRSPREWKRRVYTGKTPDSSVRDKFTTHRFIRDNQAPQTSIEVYSKTVDNSGNTAIFWSGRHFFNKISADKLLYSYRLDNGEWSRFSSRQNHTFTGLSHGNHIFKVRALDTEGNIDESPAEIEFNVTPPVWLQTWFIVMIVSFILILSFFQYLIIKKREVLKKLNRSLQRANDQLESRNLEVQHQKDELEILVKKIDELSQAKVKFFTNITHEFRTPLSLILGPIDQLSKNVQSNTTVLNFYTVIKKNALRLQKLINQLLEVRRIESGNLELVLYKRDLVSFIDDVKKLFNNQANDRNIRFSFYSDYEKMTIFFDQDKIEKILFNLLSNAFKHTPSKGTVQVKLLQPIMQDENDMQNYIRLIVQDNGNGMDDKIKGQLFERFAIGNNEINEQKRESSGIGLSYIKDLIEFHKGRITVESESNNGTVFTVHIPSDLTEVDSHEGITSIYSLEPKSSMDASLLASELQVSQLGVKSQDKENHQTILVTEDNDDMRYFISNLLGENYRVLTATNGEEGLSILDKEYVDLVVSDIMMPKVDGIAFCQKIKSNSTISHIPVILLTALGIDEKRISGYESGADSYIVKPFNPDLLLARVENLLEIREGLKSKFAYNLRFKPKDVKVTSVDEVFMEKLSSLMEEFVSDSQFDVSKMCEMTHMSHMHFIRKVKQLTGKKPVDLLKAFRLSRAKQLLEQNKINVAEVGYMVGYDLPNSFTRAFKQEFGISPTKFVEEQLAGNMNR